MAPHPLHGFLFLVIFLCALVDQAKGTELHNVSTATTIQAELTISSTDKASQGNLLSKPYPSSFHRYDKNFKAIKHFAIYQSRQRVFRPFYGAKATINVWGSPETKYSAVTSSQIWVANEGNGSYGNMNVVQAGWHVNPAMYHDNFTHFYIYWTADGYQKTGCYNLECPGFIMTYGSKFVPGYRLAPLSKYKGQQYYITLKIYRDERTGDWLLFEGAGNAPNFVGYWPGKLFNTLDGASLVEWGGHVVFLDYDKGPSMGSGMFSSGGEGMSASFKFVEYVDGYGNTYHPSGFETRVADKDQCYDVGPFLQDDHGWHFYYGGPAGCNN